MSTSVTLASNEDAIFGSILPPRDSYPLPELALTMSIVLAGRRWRALVDEQLRELGHSASRMEAMSAIAYAPPETTQIQIAKRIGIEGPTLTRTLDLLEADGLVERLPDPTDRRNKLMKLTQSGYAALGEMLQITGKLRGQLLADIPASDIQANLRFLSMLLDRIGGGLAAAPTD